MHEISIIEFTMNTVQKHAAKQGITVIAEIRLVIGKLRLAVPELLQRGFAILKMGTVFENARLIIEERDPLFVCPACGHTFAPSKPHRIPCPKCGEADPEIRTGNEMYIDSYKGCSTCQTDEKGDTHGTGQSD